MIEVVEKDYRGPVSLYFWSCIQCGENFLFMFDGEQSQCKCGKTFQLKVKFTDD